MPSCNRSNSVADLAYFINQNKIENINNIFNQRKFMVDIFRMNGLASIGNYPIEMLIKKVLKEYKTEPDAELDLFVTRFFKTIFKEIYPSLSQKKQQEYETHFSRFFNQNFLQFFAEYLYYLNMIDPSQTYPCFNKRFYKVTLDENAIYINISYTVLIFPSEDQYCKLKSSLLPKNLKFRTIEGSTTFKIVTESCKEDRIKIETSIIDSQLRDEKEYTDYSIKKNSILNSIIELIKRFIGWIKGETSQKTIYLNPKLSKQEKIETLCAESPLNKKDKIEVPPLDLSLNKEHIIETLYFDPHLNKYAENLEDFNHKTLHLENNAILKQNQPTNDLKNRPQIDPEPASKEIKTKKQHKPKVNQLFLFNNRIKKKSNLSKKVLPPRCKTFYYQHIKQMKNHNKLNKNLSLRNHGHG